MCTVVLTYMYVVICFVLFISVLKKTIHQKLSFLSNEELGDEVMGLVTIVPFF